MDNQRRTFLKVIAAGPLVACAGSVSTTPEDVGGATDLPRGADAGSGGSGTAGGAAGGGAAGQGGTGSAGTTAMVYPGTPAGNVSSFPVGTLVIAARSFVLGRDAQGFYAMSLSCTHQGCPVTPSGNQLFCPCHRSLFDANGNVLQGPARTPLPHFPVFVDSAGNITVDRTMRVSSSARTAA